MTVRRKGLVVLGVVVLLALGGAAAFVAADPHVRARYHLRRVSPSDVNLRAATALTFKSHALAYAENPVAKDFLPELLDLAKAEAELDAKTLYRPLVFEVASRAAGEAPVDTRCLAVLVGALRSQHDELREWALARMPIEPRVLLAVIELGEHGGHGDRFLAIGWLAELARLQRGVIPVTEPVWVELTSASVQGRSYISKQRKFWARLATSFEENRARLPEQVK